MIKITKVGIRLYSRMCFFFFILTLLGPLRVLPQIPSLLLPHLSFVSLYLPSAVVTLYCPDRHASNAVLLWMLLVPSIHPVLSFSEGQIIFLTPVLFFGQQADQ